MDSLCTTSRTHSFLSLTGTCVQCGSDAHLRALYSKFDNREKLIFSFRYQVLEYQKKLRLTSLPNRLYKHEQLQFFFCHMHDSCKKIVTISEFQNFKSNIINIRWQLINFKYSQTYIFPQHRRYILTWKAGFLKGENRFWTIWATNSYLINCVELLYSFL